ncbi:MAG: sigma-E factor regulatory protein RseB domain-containing protein [Terracidiphilus sp.]|jgi:hypothetical protein
MSFKRGRRLLIAIAFAFPAAGASPQNAGPIPAPSLNTTQIVERMQRHNQDQTNQLKQYKALRHYKVEYQGFPANATAKMDVEVEYDASSGKSFRIVSESGSKFLSDKVLKRAVDSEKEASQDKGLTALSQANYRFHLAGTENVAGRPAYMLVVEPLKATKFLYRGRIWVDAADFAVVKMETEPAKSPSIFISRTAIHYTSAMTDSFWLPQRMRSETKVRIGGTAVFTIDYGTYQIGSKAG